MNDPVLDHEIQQTRAELRYVMDQIADRTVEVSQTMRRWVRELSLKHQVHERPGTVLGVSFTAGVGAGCLMSRRRVSARKQQGAAYTAPRPINVVKTELTRVVMPVALGIGASVLGDWARKRYPKAEPYISLAQSALLRRL